MAVRAGSRLQFRPWFRPEAVVLIWYPILAEPRHVPLIAGLAPLPATRVERRFEAAKGMVGSGLIGVNLPHGFGL